MVRLITTALKHAKQVRELPKGLSQRLGGLQWIASLSLTCAFCATFPDASFGQGTIVLGPGQVILDSTVIPDGTTVIVDGGSIGLGVDLANGQLEVLSGNVALGATGIPTGFTNTANQVMLRGGVIGGFFQLGSATQFEMTGGSIESFGVFSGSTAEISGGTISRFPDIFSNGTVDITGGDVFSIRVFSGGTVNLFGSEFALDGVPIALELGVTEVVVERNVTLTGILEDGTIIETDLSTTAGDFSGPNPDTATADSTVTVTWVPEPHGPIGLFAGFAALFACNQVRRDTSGR